MKLMKMNAEAILFFFFATVFVQSLLFFLHLPLTAFSMGIAFLLWIGYRWIMDGKQFKKETFLSMGFVLILIGGAFLYFSHFIETTYDGAFYHGAAMTELLQGWNPVYDQMNHISSNVTYWVDYYPKTTWLFSACLIQIFNSLSAGMMINFLIAVACSLYAVPFIYKRSHSKTLSIMVAVVLLLNPIAIEQLHTYYVDAILGNLVILLLMMGIEITDEYSVATNFMIFVVSVLLINIKFTGFGFAGIVNVFIYLVILMKKNKQAIFRYTAFGAAMLLVGVCVIGFNPYFINIINGRHIFFPIAGKEAIDVIEYLIPQELLGTNPIYKFQYSILGGQTFIESLKNFELPEYLLFDQQIGAFGTYFSKLVLMSLVGCVIYIVRLSKDKKRLLRDGLICLGLVMTIVANYKNVWWVRYAPQIWTIIPLGMIGAWKNKKTRIISILLCAMVLYQNTTILQNTIKTDYEKTESIMNYYNAHQGETVTITIRKFQETYDTLDVYWFDSYERMRSRQLGVNVEKVVHEVEEDKINECYHMHVYKVCTVKVK